MKHWMFRCREVSQKVSLSMDEDLPWSSRMAVWMHLLMCRYCFRFYRQIRALRSMSHYIGRDPAHAEDENGLSLQSKDRMKKTLDAMR